MKTDDEGAPAQITSEQYRELMALFEYWFDRILGPSSETDPRHEPERESPEALRTRLLAQEARFDYDVLRIEYWEGYQLKLRRDLRTVEPLLDCLESKALGRPPIHLGWDPLLTALEEWNEPLYENLPLPDPLEPPPWDPRAARSSARDSTD